MSQLQLAVFESEAENHQRSAARHGRGKYWMSTVDTGWIKNSRRNSFSINRQRHKDAAQDVVRKKKDNFYRRSTTKKTIPNSQQTTESRKSFNGDGIHVVAAARTDTIHQNWRDDHSLPRYFLFAIIYWR